MENSKNSIFNVNKNFNESDEVSFDLEQDKFKLSLKNIKEIKTTNKKDSATFDAEGNNLR